MDKEEIAKIIRDWGWVKKRVEGEARDSAEHFELIGVEQAAERIASLTAGKGE